NAPPDMVALANAVKEAGGRVKMDSFYKNSAPERMIEAWKTGHYLKAAGLSVPSVFELAAKPIMEHIVPLQKLGVFGDMAKKVLTGKAREAELTHRASYVAALPVTVGLYGAAYQYLRTGEGPQELKDYFFPKTGEVDADGNAERVQVPSYMKDMIAYAGHPWET